MTEFNVETHQREEIIDVTREINARIPRTIADGVCVVHCPHTTAGLTVNENADPDVKHDVLADLNRLAPHQQSYYQHAEGNSAAHLKAMLTGSSLTLPFHNGSLQLGIWQGVWFCEYDGPRLRRVQLTFIQGVDK